MKTATTNGYHGDDVAFDEMECVVPAITYGTKREPTKVLSDFINTL